MRLSTLVFVLSLVASRLFCATTHTITETPPPKVFDEPAAATALPKVMLSDLLTSKPLRSFAGDSFYEEVPPELEQGVRWAASDNFTSATELFRAKVRDQKTDRERARVMMWLGLTLGQQALSYPDRGVEGGTSSSAYLAKAIGLDPAVFGAPDVARTMADMVGSGWDYTHADPAKTLEYAQSRAEQTRRSVDFYYAACLQRKIAQRAWTYIDTAPLDQRTVALFAKAVACNPEVYESWTGYIPSLAPVGMHDLMSTEVTRMFSHFKGLRCPLLCDQGPAALCFGYRAVISIQADEEFLAAAAREKPDDPYPPFQLALMSIETTPSLAVKRFEAFVEAIASGKIRPAPREAGYHPSALYKLAFVLQRERGLKDAVQMYERVKATSPHYAETDGNIALLCLDIARNEKDPAIRNQWISKGIAAAKDQQLFDYRGKASQNAEQTMYKLLALKSDADKR